MPAIHVYSRGIQRTAENRVDDTPLAIPRQALKENAQRMERIEDGIRFFTYITMISTIGICFNDYMAIVAEMATVIAGSLMIRLYSVDNRVLVWNPNDLKWIITHRQYFSSFKHTLSSWYPNPNP